jgi:hypothetical protein
VRLRGRPGGGQITGLGIDPKCRDHRAAALADIEHIAPIANRHDRRPAGRCRLALLGEFAGLIDREDRDLVRILQSDVKHTRHDTPP